MGLIRIKIIVVALIVVALVLIIVLREGGPGEDLSREGVTTEELGPGIQSVALAFADRTATRLVEERREIAVGEDRATRARRVLEELARGPLEGGVRTLPSGTRILSVYFDDTGGVYVNFSAELTTQHPGGSTGELFTIRSVVRTLALNFPDVEAVQFLVEGEEIESIAGHIDAAVPFDVEQYR